MIGMSETELYFDMETVISLCYALTAIVYHKNDNYYISPSVSFANYRICLKSINVCFDNASNMSAQNCYCNLNLKC